MDKAVSWARLKSKFADDKAVMAAKNHAQSSENFEMAKVQYEELENMMTKLNDRMQLLLSQVHNGYNDNPKPTAQQLQSWTRQLNAVKSRKISLAKFLHAQKPSYLGWLNLASAAAREAEETQAAAATAFAALLSLQRKQFR